MSIDIYAIRDRVTSRAYGWSNTAGAPDPVRQATAAHRQAVTALDDALVDYEMETSQRDRALRQHNEAVTVALRDGKQPPTAKVPSLEALEVKHGAIIAAREKFVQEAASAADRVAAEHYPAWRAEVLQQLQAAAAALAQATMVASQTAADWGGAAQVLARLDRTWAPRTAKFDSAPFLGLVDRWLQMGNIESTQLGQNVARQTARLQQMTEDPFIVEYDPTGGMEQYSAEYLAQQSPATREVLLRQVADSTPGATPEQRGGVMSRMPDGSTVFVAD